MSLKTQYNPKNWGEKNPKKPQKFPISPIKAQSKKTKNFNQTCPIKLNKPQKIEKKRKNPTKNVPWNQIKPQNLHQKCPTRPSKNL